MKIILVTGGCGYIGSVCVQRLTERGYQVVIIDNFNTGNRQSVDQRIPFYQGNIKDRKLLEEIFTKHSIDAVMHFAAITTIEQSTIDPAIYFDTNLVGGLSLLEVMKKYKCNKIIFSSTAAVFGNPISIPIHENHPTNPINSYGLSKLMFEQILFWYHKSYDLRYRIFRYFNAAGATQISGDRHPNENHLIPKILNVGLGLEKEVTIYGKDYQTPDGTCIRDFIHVIDLVDAHILALENWEENPTDIFNLGNQRGYSVLEVVETARKVTGQPLPIKFSDRRPGDPPILIAANSHARQALKWIPHSSSLEEMVKSQWDWQKRNYSRK